MSATSNEWVDAAYRLATAAGDLVIATDSQEALRDKREALLNELRTMAESPAPLRSKDAAALWRRGVRSAVQALDRTIVSKWRHAGRRQWRDAASELDMVLQAVHDEPSRHSPATWKEAAGLDDALVNAIIPLIGKAPVRPA